MPGFSQAAKDNLMSYVYFLQDPRNGEVFYVGKGVGDQVFSHLAESVETDAGTEKIEPHPGDSQHGLRSATFHPAARPYRKGGF